MSDGTPTIPCRKISLEFNFVYLGNKEIYRIFKEYCTIYVLFSKKKMLL